LTLILERRGSTIYFLFRLEFDDADAFSFLVGLYETNAMRFAELEVWLRRHVSPAV